MKIIDLINIMNELYVIRRKDYFLFITYMWNFYKRHFIVYSGIKQMKEKNKFKKLKQIPFFAWFKTFVICIIIYLICFFSLISICSYIENIAISLILHTILFFIMIIFFIRKNEKEMKTYNKILLYNIEILKCNKC